MSPAFSKRLSGCLIALMLVIVRIADAHAHLCADGKEPPTVIHLGDGGSHPCQTDAATEHSGDKDVQIAADVLLKKSSLADVWMPPLQASIVEFIAPRSAEPIIVEPREPRVATPFRLRPPLRGPPI